MNLYLENGYFNFDFAFERKIPFNFIWGARGTGKTYGSITKLASLQQPFIYLRRTQTQADMVKNPKLSPFKIPLEDLDIEFDVKKLDKNVYGIFSTASGDLIAVTLALTTFANIRGFDGSSFKYMIYDEFIPEEHVKVIRNESEAFLNCYETVARNRELAGQDPLYCFCLSNSDNIACPLFMGMNILEPVLAMAQNGESFRYLQNRSIGLYQLTKSPISEQKAKTALYKAIGEGNFKNMALYNIFNNVSTANVKSMNLKTLIPMIDIGEIMIYRTKDKRTFYVSPHKMQAKYNFSLSDTDLKRFRLTFQYLWYEYLRYNVFFENYTSEVIFKTYYES